MNTCWRLPKDTTYRLAQEIARFRVLELHLRGAIQHANRLDNLSETERYVTRSTEAYDTEDGVTLATITDSFVNHIMFLGRFLP